MALMSSFLQGGEVFMALMSSFLQGGEVFLSLMSSYLQGGVNGSNKLLLAGCGESSWL